VNDEEKRAFDYVQSLNRAYAEYNHKKEREAYVIVVLYLGATAAALINNGWDLPIGLLLLALIIGTSLTAVLVFWQLRNRRFAARMVAACTTVASQWLTENPAPADYRATSMQEILLPDAVVREFGKVRSTETLILMIALPLVILAWGAAVVCYFWGIL
jgi:uncharacterized membrane-anchored protein